MCGQRRPRPLDRSAPAWCHRAARRRRPWLGRRRRVTPDSPPHSMKNSPNSASRPRNRAHKHRRDAYVAKAARTTPLCTFYRRPRTYSLGRMFWLRRNRFARVIALLHRPGAARMFPRRAPAARDPRPPRRQNSARSDPWCMEHKRFAARAASEIARIVGHVLPHRQQVRVPRRLSLSDRCRALGYPRDLAATGNDQELGMGRGRLRVREQNTSIASSDSSTRNSPPQWLRRPACSRRRPAAGARCTACRCTRSTAGGPYSRRGASTRAPSFTSPA